MAKADSLMSTLQAMINFWKTLRPAQHESHFQQPVLEKSCNETEKVFRNVPQLLQSCRTQKPLAETSVASLIMEGRRVNTRVTRRYKSQLNMDVRDKGKKELTHDLKVRALSR